MPALRLSRYEYASVEVDSEGRKFLDVPDPITKRNFGDDQFFTVGEDATLFQLSWKAYRSAHDPEQDVRPSGFFWVVGEANDVVDAAATLQAGKSYRVPSVESLFGEVLVPPPFFSQGSEVVA